MLQISNSMNHSSTSTDRNWKRLCWAASWIALAGICLIKAIPTSPSHAPTAAKSAAVASHASEVAPLPAKRLPLRTKSIETIRVGDRVLGKNPQRADTDRSAVDPDPATWRKLQLRMTKQSGKRLDIVLLRPSEWVSRRGAHVGGTILLELQEFGAVGQAEVLGVGPCPPIKPAEGAVVTGTFAHEPDGDLVDVWLERHSDPITCTGNHLFWSENSQIFIEAQALRSGERLRSRAAGLVTVSSVRHRPSGGSVFNLEIHGEHVYEVTNFGVVVHNRCEDGTVPDEINTGGQGNKVTQLDPINSLPPLRQAYIREIEGLANLAHDMQQAGASLEQIARAMHAERRALGIKYKDLTASDLLEKIYQRNLQKYGDRLGPSIDWLLGKGKSWVDIIESAMTPGGADLGLGR